MRILSIVDKKGSAIDRLAELNKKYNPNLIVNVVAVHPKRPSPTELSTYEQFAKEADVLDFQYWRTALMLLEKYPEYKDKPKCLAHHNPYDLKRDDWSDFELLIANNSELHQKLGRSIMIPNAVDLNYFSFNQEYTEKKNVLMVAARIEAKKGILEVADVCGFLGYNFTLVGNISDVKYIQDCIFKGAEFKRNITDEQLLEEYKNAAILVCNSVDNFESGTLPILEAMAMGVPVLTRRIGLVPDLYDGKNMIIRDGQPDDTEDLKKVLYDLMEHPDIRKDMRYKAFHTVRHYGAEKRAIRYSIAWNSLLYKIPLVSVIIPTYNRKEELKKIIDSIAKQIYSNIEIIVCDDNSEEDIERLCEGKKFQIRQPIRYLNTLNDGYGLAQARNMGAVEAQGEFLMFLDSRLELEKDAIEELMIKARPDWGKCWFYGNKGSSKKNFVENFSLIRKDSFMDAGMFCERMDCYGGLTEETSKRFAAQNFSFIIVPEAKAKPLYNSKSKWRNLHDIYKAKLKIWKMYGESEFKLR